MTTTIPVTKGARQQKIVDLLESTPRSASQTELADLLAAAGVERHAGDAVARPRSSSTR